MALSQNQKLAMLERWMRVLHANYLRYGVEHALYWKDRASFEDRRTIEKCVEEQRTLFNRMVEAAIKRGGVLPPLGYPEDVAYLNYVHLPVLVQRAIQRMRATVPPFRDDLAVLEAAAEFALVDLGEAYIELVEAQSARLAPLFAEAEQVSPK